MPQIGCEVSACEQQAELIFGGHVHTHDFLEVAEGCVASAIVHSGYTMKHGMSPEWLSYCGWWTPRLDIVPRAWHLQPSLCKTSRQSF